MSASPRRTAAELFEELCDLDEPERGARLAKATAGDPELRRELEELLAEDARASGFLEEPLLGDDFRLSGPYSVTGGPVDDSGAWERPPEAIGPYRVAGTIGSGGVGIVYRAEQQRPRRWVALKVLRASFPDARAHRQFELEADALGRLEHPGIARIHDAGTADFGRGPVPFLVMELVEGADLASCVERRGLDVRARVELLVRVCRAVHHAHQKGVIHRDLKPANVLVTEGGEPKVVDFGLALLTDGERTTVAAAESGRLLGTLAYMSPEQLGAEHGGVDAASDVYGLGATLHHVLTGRAPFDLGGLSLAAALHRVAHGEPGSLRRALGVDRDLAAVVGKALGRQKEHRYRSADALADDLERWLRDEAVGARAPGRLEQLRRFARRNRLLVGSAAALVLVLAAGIVATTWQAWSARREARRAVAMRTYLEDTLRSAGDPRTDGRELSISHVLDRASGGLDEAFEDDPLTRADLAHTLGMAYFEVGRYEDAERLVADVCSWRARALGPDDLETLAARNDLGIVLVALGEHREAEGHLRAALDGRRAALGDDAEPTLRSANWLGQVLLQGAEPDEAEDLFRDSWEARRRTLGDEAVATLSSRKQLALVWRRQGRLEEAEGALAEILEVERRVCGPSDFAVYETVNNLASLLLDLGRFEESERLLVEALEGYRRLRGSEHSDTRLVAQNLGVAREHVGRASPSAQEPEEEPAPTADHPRAHALAVTMATQKFYRGRIAEAESDLRAAIDALERIGGQERYLRPARQCLASVLLEQGRLEDAMRIQREELAAHRAAGTEDSQYALTLRSTLAEALRRSDRLEEALEEATFAFEQLHEQAGKSALYTLSARVVLSAILADLGHLDEAFAHSSNAVGLAEESFPDPSSYTEVFRVRHGRTLVALGRYEEAQSALLGAREKLVELRTERGPYSVHAARALADLYAAWGRPEEAERWVGVAVRTTSTPAEAASR